MNKNSMIIFAAVGAVAAVAGAAALIGNTPQDEITSVLSGDCDDVFRWAEEHNFSGNVFEPQLDVDLSAEELHAFFNQYQLCSAQESYNKLAKGDS